MWEHVQYYNKAIGHWAAYLRVRHQGCETVFGWKFGGQTIALSPHMLIGLLILLFALAIFSGYKPLQATNSEAIPNSSVVPFFLRSLQLI